MNLILKGYWSNNPISVDEVIQNPELVLRVPVGMVTIAAGVDKAYVDEQDSLLGNEFATALQALDDKKANVTAVTEALSTKADLIGGVIPANQLPSFNVDSVGSVNGQTGVVVLDADDVGATTQVYVDTQDNLIINSLTLKADTNYVDTQDGLLQDQIDLKADAMAVSQSLALKADLVGGVIPSYQLPSYVGVLNFPDLASFPFVGEDGKIYIAEDVNKTYRWGGSSYVEIGGGGVALGETSSTAYRGDNGKIAYDHSVSTGNPHNSTTSDIPEGTRFYFTEERVRLTPLVGLVLQNSAVVSTDSIVNAIGKLQGQVNTKTSLSLGEGSTDAYRGDRGKVAYDHSQSQGNPHNTTTSDINEGTKLFFTESRVNQTVLTGLNTSTATPALATDQLLAAIGKLQAQINNIAPPTWVSAASIGTTHSSFINVQFAKINGLLWIRGYCNSAAAVGSGTTLFLLTDPSYHLDIPTTSTLSNRIGEIRVFSWDAGAAKTIQLKNNVNNANKFSLLTFNNFAANEYNQIQPVALGRLLTP